MRLVFKITNISYIYSSKMKLKVKQVNFSAGKLAKNGSCGREWESLWETIPSELIFGFQHYCSKRLYFSIISKTLGMGSASWV